MDEMTNTYKVLVTGGCGFIGSHVVEELLAHGHTVSVVDNLSSSARSHIDNKHVDFYLCDINDAVLETIIGQITPDIVIHLAAQVSVAESVHNMKKDLETNVKGTLNVIEAGAKHHVKKIVFASSAAVYGNPQYLPIDVRHPTEPLSPYGLSKLAAENYLKIAKEIYGLDYTVLRYSNVYGPRQNTRGEGGVVAVFAEALARKGTLQVYGNGEQTRDFIFVQDIAKANRAAMSAASGKVLNLSSNKRTSINELIGLLADIKQTTVTPVYTQTRLGDIEHSQLNNDEAQQLLGLSLDYDLKRGLEETLLYYENRV